ncbi:MAG: TatD family hydrolase [Muribaculaceae bacterium]|nr:TatD family hydrolase [Muribaculaceae bacterium]
MNILDFHTHHAQATDALISVEPRQFDPQAGKWYSVGVHPWDTVEAVTDADFDLLKQCATHAQVLAIGETGLDSLRGGDIETQTALFVRHLQLAHDVCKPVVVHNVRTTQQILNARRQAGLTDVRLAIHGMRGNAHVARTLLDEGCYLSYGLRFNPEALATTPLDRLLIETDDSDITIQDVATRVALVLGLSTEVITTTAAENARRLLMK